MPPGCGCGMLSVSLPCTLDLASLTEREREVLRLLGRGEPNRLLARRLGIAERTAKAHVARVIEKLGVADRTAAVFVANVLHVTLCSPLGRIPSPKGNSSRSAEVAKS
ncbi:response regulator transcription factor [Streptomyces chryseus]|uniref:response regulator transcription factor n=1 Tax=Streptomyces chryseus TaxID=68186 RepID=UPI00110FE9A1|nr:helix-turn-helix transcriptional regulator [Streptomyces chryseus]